GIFLASLIYIKVKKVNFRELCDVIFPSIPLGYTFGRLGNFINGELYGRITSSPIGMFFPDAQKLPIKFPEVSKVINDIGWKINELNQTVVDGAGNIINNVLGKMTISGEEVTTINLPRHPSQLYEAFFEGIVLFFIVWFLGRKYKPFKGFTASVYLVGYALARIFVEFFRQPDSQFANIEQGKLTGFIVSFFSMGQILSFLMILFAIGLGFYFYKLSLDDKLKPKIETKTKNKKNK
ncbi:MAG: prolipoprotein diacylglyceryl transferase, partial [Spirochaetes bacterium GWB1_27_13]